MNEQQLRFALPNIPPVHEYCLITQLSWQTLLHNKIMHLKHNLVDEVVEASL